MSVLHTINPIKKTYWQPMNSLDKQSLDELGVISNGDKTSATSATSTSDVLSIVLDAINSSIGGLIITDLAGSICFANPAFCNLLDYSREEIIGINAADLFSTRTISSISDVIALIDNSKDGSGEFIITTQSGEKRFVEVSASDVTSTDGQVVGRMASFADITGKKEIELEREGLINQLQEALAKIKVLRGIIPICSSCKKIRDDKGYWNQLEIYIQEHSEANFSHGICPECVTKLYPDLFKTQRK